jgi:fatty-acyl-CoA synthase
LISPWNPADLTNQVIDSDGWLHTGDLGWLDNNNYLHYCERIKELINRGGEKINPAEVESAISEISGIKLCKVIGIPDDYCGEEIYACIILTKGTTLPKNESWRQIQVNIDTTLY